MDTKGKEMYSVFSLFAVHEDGKDSLQHSTVENCAIQSINMPVIIMEHKFHFNLRDDLIKTVSRKKQRGVISAQKVLQSLDEV
jgi:hypothetical protein